ncbi:MAG: S41 family peptidase [Bacteroidota bacterium]
MYFKNGFKSTKILQWCIVVVFFLTTCTTQKIDENPLPQYTFLKDEARINPEFRGIWRSIGNGYLLDASGDSIRLYSYTKGFCYKEKNDYLEGLFNTQTRFYIDHDTLRVFLTDFGKRTQHLQSAKVFLKVNALPETCLSFSQMQALDSEQLFTLYLETLQENYAFADERKLDWNAIKNEYGSRININSPREELFEVMGEIATLTRDQHTKVIREDGTSRQYRVTPSAQLVRNAFDKQDSIQDLNEYFGLFFKNNYQNISDSLLQGKGNKMANGKIEWGSLNDDIGYIHLHSLAGFLSREFTRRQQIDSLNSWMKHIVTVLEHKKALIIDVSFNFGGYDATALTVASYFTDTQVFSHTSQVYNNGEFYDEDNVAVYPSDSKSFTKPVYVLMTDISRSAAESFAMMMSALPSVKLVGTPTLGTLSGMLGKSIGSYYTTYSNQRLVTPEGEHYEVTGVQPDIELPIFFEDNIFQSHKIAVRKLAKIIQKEVER